jgi:cytochrome c heme-lyase
VLVLTTTTTIFIKKQFIIKMGGGISKHQDEVAVDTTTTTTTTTKPSNNETSSSVQQQEQRSSPPEEESKCPMHRSDGSYSYDWRQLFKAAAVHGPKGSKPLSKEEQEKAITAPPGGCPVKHNDSSSSASGCPVAHETSNSTQYPEYNVYSQPIDKTNQMPRGARTQLPNATQTMELSTDRVSSSIPKGGDTSTTWTYPSPQQFYNALSRKGKLNSDPEDDASEEDMASVVALHNNMNEKTWAKVVEWERQTFHENATPKLLKFMGRPHDLSPKARFKHYVLGHPLPYDRHDWTVLREDGTTVRYVIDYYYDESRARETEDSSMPHLLDHDATPSLLVDVRPALDGPEQLYARAVRMPYKIYTDQTSYQQLPLLGTPEMARQVQESIQVWKNIQQSRKQQQQQQKQQEDIQEEAAEVAELIKDMMTITEPQAKEIALTFAKAIGKCRKQQKKMAECSSEQEFSTASIDLTMCMGEIICPVQHKSLVKVLSDQGEEDGDKIEAALETLTECVMLKTAERRVAREQHPSLFES